MAKITPPSSPMMSVPYTAEEALLSDIPGVPDAPDAPDDIPDPVVPAGTIEATGPPATAGTIPDALVPLAHGFCQYVQGLLGKQLDDAGVKMARSVDTTVTEMANFTKGVLASNEHASYSFADALVKFAQASQETPYQVTLRATSQEGFPVEVTIRKATAAELVDEMGRLVGWLTANGYNSQSEAWRA